MILLFYLSKIEIKEYKIKFLDLKEINNLVDSVKKKL